MKHLAGILFLFTFLLPDAWAQEEQQLKKLMSAFGDMCSKVYPGNELLGTRIPNPKNIWEMESITKVTATGACEEAGKTDVYFPLSYVDLQYSPNFFLEGIVKNLHQTLIDENKNWNSPLNMYCKPGKLFCFSNDQCSIRIISFNTCADMKSLKNLTSLYRKLDKYDAVLVVKCGVDPRDVELIRKNK